MSWNLSPQRKNLNPVVRFALVFFAACLMALNLNTFVHSAGLLPGGFTGLSLLIQEALLRFAGIRLPFSLLYWPLNLIPAAICFRHIGKRFTLYSCLMILLVGLFADLLPGLDVTDDVLLSAVFGGLVSGLAVCLCLFAGATSGGTDFIAIMVAERTGRDIWNYIFAGNCVVLAVAGVLFGWTRALYSIIFQFASTQILNLLYKKYQNTTLLVISDRPDEVYRTVRDFTNHDATLFRGIGCYKNAERNLLYTVVSGEEAGMVTREIRRVDPNAFINILQSKGIFGRFFRRPND